MVEMTPTQQKISFRKGNVILVFKYKIFAEKRNTFILATVAGTIINELKLKQKK